MLSLLAGRAGLRAAVAAIAMTGAAYAGYQVSAWRHGEILERERAVRAEAALKARDQARQIDALRDQAASAAAEAEALRQQKRQTVERVITEEVIRYVETDSGRHCGLDPDGVRLHDAAAANRVPEAADAAAEPDDGAAAASAAEVVATVTANYARCHEARERLTALQAWARALSAAPPQSGDRRQERSE